MVQGLLVRYANQHVQRAGLFHFRENIQERWEEVKVQLRVGFDWKRVGENYTQLQLYITKGERAPLDGRGGNVEKRERSGLVMCAACMHVCVCVCVCVTPLLCFDFEVVTLSGAGAESRRWENGNSTTWGLSAHTGGGLAFSIFLSKWKFVKQNSLEKIFCHLYSLGAALERVYVSLCLCFHVHKNGK